MDNVIIKSNDQKKALVKSLYDSNVRLLLKTIVNTSKVD